MLCKEIKIDTIYGIIVEDNMYVLSQDDIAEVKEWLADVSAEETEE